MDTGLLILRLLVGLLVIAHGLQKSVGWLQGDGFEATVQIFDRIGYTPARLMVAVAAVIEVAAGGGIALGLLTPLAAAAVFGQMLVASSAMWHNGIWAARGGCELPLTFGLIAAGIAFTGPGMFSLDAVIGWDLSRPWTGWGAIALGLASASLVIGRRRLQRSRRSPAQTQAAGAPSGSSAV